jgi:hypothetical protein
MCVAVTCMFACIVKPFSTALGLHTVWMLYIYISQLVGAQNIQLYGFGVIFNGLGLAGASYAVASALHRTFSTSA